jgi:cation transport regulator
MPYKQITQLPNSVKNNLPKGAQEIYKEAFNSAEEQYVRRAALTAWPGAQLRTSTRRTRRATGCRRIANPFHRQT